MAVNESNIKVDPSDVEWDGKDLGSTQGGIEISPSTDVTEVTADQTGTQKLDEIRTASNVEVSMTFQELTKALYDEIIGKADGDSYTGPSGEVLGYGESKRFANRKADAKQLTLKPVGATGNSENFTFWKAIPIPDTISKPGDDLKNVSVTFMCYRDTSKRQEINLFAYGDQTQDLSAS